MSSFLHSTVGTNFYVLKCLSLYSRCTPDWSMNKTLTKKTKKQFQHTIFTSNTQINRSSIDPLEIIDIPYIETSHVKVNYLSAQIKC